MSLPLAPTCRGQQRMDTEWHWSSHHHHQHAGGNERIPGRGTRDRRLETQMRLEFLVLFFLFFFFFYWLLIITLLVQDYDDACTPPQARDDNNNNNKGWDREDKGTGQGYVFLKKNYFIYLIFTPTPPTSPSLQPNLRPHQHVEAATPEWQRQQGLDVSSCRYVFFLILFLISLHFF